MTRITPASPDPYFCAGKSEQLIHPDRFDLTHRIKKTQKSEQQTEQYDACGNDLYGSGVVLLVRIHRSELTDGRIQSCSERFERLILIIWRAA